MRQCVTSWEEAFEQGPLSGHTRPLGSPVPVTPFLISRRVQGSGLAGARGRTPETLPGSDLCSSGAPPSRETWLLTQCWSRERAAGSCAPEAAAHSLGALGQGTALSALAWEAGSFCQRPETLPCAWSWPAVASGRPRRLPGFCPAGLSQRGIPTVPPGHCPPCSQWPPLARPGLTGRMCVSHDGDQVSG